MSADMLEGPCLKADEVLLLPLSARYSSTGSTDSSPYRPTACISTGNVGHYSASSINQCPSLMRDASASNLGGGETIDFPRGPSSPCVVGRSIIPISMPLFDSLNARSCLRLPSGLPQSHSQTHDNASNVAAGFNASQAVSSVKERLTSRTHIRHLSLFICLCTVPTCSTHPLPRSFQRKPLWRSWGNVELVGISWSEFVRVHWSPEIVSLARAV